MRSGRRPVVGVTGLPCAGKSFVAELLASGEATGETGLAVKADDVGHEALEDPEVVDALSRRFGRRILDHAGRIDRSKVADMAFADRSELSWLESVLHPRIDAAIAGLIDEVGGRRLLVVEAALLFAAGIEKRCDIALVVEADREVRLRRAERRGWDEKELTRRESRLLPLFEKAPGEGCGTRRAYLKNNDESDRKALSVRLKKALKGKP